MNEEILAQRRYWNNEADSFQKIYTHRKSGFSNFLDQVFRKDMYERYTYTMEGCEPVKGRSFLDVGCGNGLYSLELARKGAGKVVGIDIAEVMIGLCRQYAKSEQLSERCVFEQTDLLDFDSADKVDVSFGIGLFDYIREPLPVLKKMRQVTRDKVIASFPRYWTWRAPIRKVRLTIRGCDVFFYTEGRLRTLLKEAGFGQYTIDTVGKLYCVTARP